MYDRQHQTDGQARRARHLGLELRTATRKLAAASLSNSWAAVHTQVGKLSVKKSNNSIENFVRSERRGDCISEKSLIYIAGETLTD